MTNEEIARCVRKAQAGCHESFRRLIARQKSIIHGIIYNRLRDKSEEDREDMFQEVMLHTWHSIKLLKKDPGRFPRWMSTLTKWRCCASRRGRPSPKQFEHHQLENYDRILSVFFMHDKNFIDSILTREAISYVNRVMCKLSEEDRDMLKSEFQIRETLRKQGRRLGVHINTCYRKRKKAKENFRQALLETVAPEDLYVPS